MTESSSLTTGWLKSVRRVATSQVDAQIHRACDCGMDHMVPMRWPVPSEWSAVTTGLRLGRVVRDARLPYLRN